MQLSAVSKYVLIQLGEPCLGHCKLSWFSTTEYVFWPCSRGKHHSLLGLTEGQRRAESNTARTESVGSRIEHGPD